jgi:thermostable 8-oxoguanine DNA glycosylase
MTDQINPNNITNFSRSTDELLLFWLFCLFVRGKNADVQAKKLGTFLTNIGETGDRLVNLTKRRIKEELRVVKAGQYVTLTAAIDQTILWLNRDPFYLRHCTVAELEGITGVGPKTARFFVMHTQRDAKVAALDVHILRYLGLRLATPVPLTTPTGKKYLELEQIFLDMARDAGVEPAVMDLAIWRASRESNPMAWPEYI